MFSSSLPLLSVTSCVLFSQKAAIYKTCKRSEMSFQKKTISYVFFLIIKLFVLKKTRFCRLQTLWNFYTKELLTILRNDFTDVFKQTKFFLFLKLT